MNLSGPEGTKSSLRRDGKPMDWLDVALIVLGVMGCGLLHLTALALTRRDRSGKAPKVEARDAGSSPQEVVQ